MKVDKREVRQIASSISTVGAQSSDGMTPQEIYKRLKVIADLIKPLTVACKTIKDPAVCDIVNDAEGNIDNAIVTVADYIADLKSQSAKRTQK